MNTDRQAAKLAQNLADALADPNKETQDKISAIRGMMGEILSLDDEHIVKVFYRIVDICVKTQIIKESLAGFMAGSLFDAFENREVENNPLFIACPNLKKFVSSRSPVDVLREIIEKTKLA